jgi:hypothetical protein
MIFRMIKTVLLLASITASSCVPEEVDLEGRPCPCVDGYVCDLVTNTCTLFLDAGGEDISRADVRDSEDVFVDQGVDAGVQMDAGSDGGPVPDVFDASPDVFDASPDVFDASPDVFDAGPDVFDAGPSTFCDRHGVGSYACLDFDSDPPSPWEENTTVSAETRFDSARAISGRSVRLRVEADGDTANFGQLLAEADGVSSGTMWLRARVYLEDAETLNYLVLFALRQTRTLPLSLANLNLSGGNGRIAAVMMRNSVSFWQTPATPIPLNGWVCLEMELPIGESVDMVSYLDGLEVGRINVNSTGSWDQINVGVDAADQAQTAWLDDFIWSPERVPCDLE